MYPLSVELRQELGHFLQVSREAAGLTQKQVTDRLGLSTAQSLSNIERGTAAVPLEVLRRTAIYYRLKSSDLVKKLEDLHRRNLRELLRKGR